MNDDQMPIPFPVPGASQERDPLAGLVTAAAPIQAQIIDLERDYAHRDREFWQTTLDMLPVVRQALQPFLRALDGESLLNSDGRYTLMIPVYRLDEQIDTVGIAITAYLPRCKSYTHRNLQTRHWLLEKLRELMKTVQELIDVVVEAIEV